MKNMCQEAFEDKIQWKHVTSMVTMTTKFKNECFCLVVQALRILKMYTFSTFRFIDVPYYLLKYERSVFGKIQSNNWVAKELSSYSWRHR